MATGDTQDIVQGLKSALPRGWFSGDTPVLDALLTGLATAWSGMYSMYQYVATQARIRTATGVWLDLAALDFFGNNLPRQANELDAQYRARILAALFVEQGTRNAIYYSLLRLTGRAPFIFEPARPSDTGAYTQALLNFVNRWSNGVIRGNAQTAAAKSLTLSTTDASAADAYATSAVRIVAGSGAGQERKGIASRQNMLSYSQSFDNAAWTKTGTTSVTPNTVAAPDGTLTADTVTDADATNPSLIQQLLSAVPVGTSVTGSVYVSQGTSPQSTFNCYDTGNTECNLTVNWSGGVPSFASFTSPTGATYTISSVGNGWYRLSLTWTTSFAGSLAHRFWPASRTAATTGTCIVWGAQLEAGSGPTEYIHTEANAAIGVAINQPWSSNLLTYSQAFDNAAWTRQGITVTPNAVAAPDGSSAGTTFASATGYTAVWRSGIAIAAGSVVTLSAYFKAGTTSLPSLTLGNSGLANAMTCQFNLATGTAGAVTYAGTTTGASATIQNAGNGWYRCSITGVIDGSTTAVRCDLSIPNSSNCYVWGAQLEVARTPSPYMTTADVAILRPDATSVYDISPSAYSSVWPTNACLLGYGNAGGYGSLQMAYQALVKAYLPSTSGIPLVAGYGVLASPVVGASNGAYNTPSRTEYALIANAQNNLGLNAIYQAVDAAKPAGTIVWVGTSQ